MRLNRLKVLVPAMTCLVGLSLSGCGTGFYVDFSAPSATSTPSSIITSSSSPTEPVYVFVDHTPGESLTLLKQVERLMVRAAKLKGKANEVAQNDACQLLSKTINGVGGAVWAGLPIVEAMVAMRNCWSDPPESLKHLRVVIDALESAGVTPEPAPELTP